MPRWVFSGMRAPLDSSGVRLESSTSMAASVCSADRLWRSWGRLHTPASISCTPWAMAPAATACHSAAATVDGPRPSSSSRGFISAMQALTLRAAWAGDSSCSAPAAKRCSRRRPHTTFSSGRSPSGSDFSGQSFTPGGSTARAPTMEWLPTQLSSKSCAPSPITALRPATQPRS